MLLPSSKPSLLHNPLASCLPAVPLLTWGKLADHLIPRMIFLLAVLVPTKVFLSQPVGVVYIGRFQFLLSLSLLFCTAGIAAFGVMLKVMVESTERTEFPRKIAWVVAVSLFIFFAALDLGRATNQLSARRVVVNSHAAGPPPRPTAFCGTTKYVWCVHILAACALLLLPLMVQEAATSTAKDSRGTGPIPFALSCTCLTALLMLLEWVFIPPKSGFMLSLTLAVERRLAPEVAAKREALYLEHLFTVQKADRRDRFQSRASHRMEEDDFGAGHLGWTVM